jgi:hypothetical protein
MTILRIVAWALILAVFAVGPIAFLFLRRRD